MISRPYETVGFDVSDAIIRTARLDRDGNVAAAGAAPLPSGVVTQGRIKDGAAFAAAAEEALRDVKSAADRDIPVIASFPDTHVFIRQFDLPSGLGKNEIREAILERHGQDLPRKSGGVYVSWEPVQRKDGRNDSGRVVAAIADRAVVDEYVAQFAAAGLNVVNLQAASLATANALFSGSPATDPPRKKPPPRSADGTIAVVFRPGYAALLFHDQGSAQFMLTVEMLPISHDLLMRRVVERLKLGANWYERDRGRRCSRVLTSGYHELLRDLHAELAKDRKFNITRGDPFAGVSVPPGVRNRFKLTDAHAAAIGLALTPVSSV